MIELKLANDGNGAIGTFPDGFAIRVPLNERTGALLEQILTARQSNPQGKLGTKSAPLQEMIDDFQRRGGKITQLAPIGAARAPRGTPEKIDISIEELFA